MPNKSRVEEMLEDGSLRDKVERLATAEAELDVQRMNVTRFLIEGGYFQYYKVDWARLKREVLR